MKKHFDQFQLEKAVEFYKQGQFSEAERVLVHILGRARNEYPDALHLLGLLQHQSGHHDRAKESIYAAISHSPLNPFYYNTLGTVMRSCGETDNAARCFEKALQLKPDYAEALYNRAGIYHLQKNYDHALACYELAVAKKTDFPEAWNNMAATLNVLERYEEAYACCERALIYRLDYCEALNNQGNAAKALGKLSTSIECYRRAIHLGGENSELLCNLANALASEGRLDSAIACYEKAIRIDPTYAKAYNNLGTIYRCKRELATAAAQFKKCMSLNPHDAEPYHNMGSLYFDQGDFKTASRWYDKALSINPNSSGTQINRGVVFQETGKSEEALKCFKQVLENNPCHSKALCHMAHELYHRCEWSQIKDIKHRIADLTQAELDRREVPSEMPFLSLIRTTASETHFRIARQWSQAISDRALSDGRDRAFVHDRQPRSKLTIGYLSNNFKNHPTAHLVWQLFSIHDRECFRVNVYSYGEDDGSSYRDHIARTSDRFVDLYELDHRTAARQIYDDRVDILVDLVGFMRANRLEICAYRPAPVQVRLLGQACTTGASFFDYIITDKRVTPPNEQKNYSETFVYMPNTYQINSESLKTSARHFSRHSLSLPKHGFIYCCFCSSYKIDQQIFDLWMEIVKAVPDSVLWLIRSNDAVVRNLRSYAKSRGADPERLVFAPKVSKADHLDRLKFADLALDTIAVNGAATTSDALRSGVPVLTLKGRHFAARMSSSILNAIGLNELSVETGEAYLESAVAYGKNPSRLNRLKAKLAANQTREPLFDTSRFVKDLESAFKRMWNDYRSGKKNNPD